MKTRLILFNLLLFIGSFVSNGQTNPTAVTLPFSLTSQASTTLPTGVAAHRFGTSAGAIPTSRITTDANGDLPRGTTSNAGGWHNMTDDGIALLASGTQSAGALIVAINTTGKTNITISWICKTILNQASWDNSIALQYRVGTSGSFIDVGTTSTYSSAGNSAGHTSSTFTETLPAGAENQSVVQVRWIYWAIPGGSSARDKIAVDDISITGSSSCAAPASISKNNITSASADLSWGTVSGASGYQYALTGSVTPPASGTNIAGTTYNATGLTANTKYYFHVRSDCGGGTYSGWTTDSVTTLNCVQPTINTEPTSDAICQNANKTFTVAATGDGLTYQWQLNSGSGFSNLSNSAPYSNTQTTALTITSASASLNGYLYRCIVTGSCGADTSAQVTLTVNTTYSISNPQTICNGGSYAFNGHTYSTAGNYRDTLHTSAGCDSIIVTQLTVNPTYTTNNTQTICDGGSYTFNGHSYTTAGNHYDTLQTINGCDSIVTTMLTVNPAYTANNPQAICNGDIYSFNGHNYTMAGSYTDTLTSVNGCDSIVTTILTVNPTYSNNNPQTICNGASYSFNGHTYTTAGNYNDTLHTINGCDSIIVTQLTVNPSYSANNPQTTCNGGAYSFNGHTYTTAGNYNDTLHSINGCDSIIVTQLTVNPSYSTNNPQTICNGGAYSFNGHTYTTAGNYNDTLHSINGCDSIIVTQLTVNPSYSISNPQTICNGGSYSFNGHTYTTAGNHYDTLQTVNGCDSIIVTQLAVTSTYSVNNPQTICNGGSYAFNGHTYTSAGNYNDTLHTVNGCDSIIVTILTVNPTYSVNNPQTICNGHSYGINGHTYSVAGNYNDTLHTVNGCDSIIVTMLTVNPTYTSNNSQTICNGGAYNFNGHTYSVAGNYNDTLHTVNGCDSIIVTMLTVNPTYTSNNPQTICNGGAYTFNGHTYSVAGNYNDTLHAVTGCDSIILTMLTVNPSYSISNPQTICSGGSYTFNAHIYTIAGNYNDTLFTTTGCDSIIVTQLTVNPKPATSVISGNATPQINTSDVYSVVNTTGSTYNWIITGGTQTAGGNTNSITVLWGNTVGGGDVKVVETNLTGCTGDTISQGALISFPVDLISFTGKREKSLVTLNWRTASEQNNSHFVVQRSTDDKYFESIGKVKGQVTKTSQTNYEYTDNISTQNSSISTIYYRLIQTDFDGTTATSQVISVEIGSATSIQRPQVYPNPFTDALNIALPQSNVSDISIRDITGKVVFQSTGSVDHTAPVIIYTNELKAGLYILHIKSAGSEYTQKILKN